MMVYATVAIALLSFGVWLHHFFTMGAGADVNAFFGMMTMIIAVPTGVKVFNWLFTMYRGRIRFTPPMMTRKADRYRRSHVFNRFALDWESGAEVNCSR